MPVAGGQQSDLAGVEPLVEEGLDRVVGGAHGVVGRDVDHTHGCAGQPAGPHGPVGEGAEGLGDLLGGAQVLVEQHGVELDGRLTVAREHPLVVVHEHEQAAVLGVPQAAQERRPPGGPEVLRLVDHHGVEQLGGGLLGGELAERARQRLLPVLRVVVAAALGSPPARQVVEEAHERRPFGGPPRRHLTFQVAPEPPRVADERDALALLGLAAGLLEREPRLAGARSPDHAHPPLEPQRVEERALVAGQPLHAGLVLGALEQRLDLAGERAAEVVDELGDSALVERARATGPAVEPERRRDPLRGAPGAVEVAPVDHHVPRQVGRGVVGGHVGERERDEVHERRVRGGQACAAQQVGERVARTLHLGDGVDGPPCAVGPRLEPPPTGAGDVPALDLDRRDPEPRPRHEEVDLGLDVELLEVHAVEDHRVVGELRAQRLPHEPLGAAVRREQRFVRVGAGRHGFVIRRSERGRRCRRATDRTITARLLANATTAPRSTNSQRRNGFAVRP